jgi:hypothetical protein
VSHNINKINKVFRVSMKKLVLYLKEILDTLFSQKLVDSISFKKQSTKSLILDNPSFAANTNL